MLDIYLVKEDFDVILDDPDETNFLGSISLNQHKSLGAVLEQCKLKGIHLPYFKDSLLNHEQIQEMKEIFDKHKHLLVDEPTSRDAYELITSILSIVLQKMGGIVCYCD